MVGQSKARENVYFFFRYYYLYLYSYALRARPFPATIASLPRESRYDIIRPGIKLVSPRDFPRQLIKTTADVYTPCPCPHDLIVNYGSLLSSSVQPLFLRVSHRIVLRYTCNMYVLIVVIQRGNKIHKTANVKKK